jgi:hypothetical protein
MSTFSGQVAKPRLSEKPAPSGAGGVTQVVYNGPYEQVEVPTLGLIATRGESIDVAEADGKLLCEQECWEPANKSAGRSRKADKTEEGD